MITVALDKPAEKIAKDIKSRLLKDAGVYWEFTEKEAGRKLAYYAEVDESRQFLKSLGFEIGDDADRGYHRGCGVGTVSISSSSFRFEHLYVNREQLKMIVDSFKNMKEEG